MTIYELITHGDSVGFFPTEADARHHAAYMPAAAYYIRAWIDDGDFITFNRNTGRIIKL